MRRLSIVLVTLAVALLPAAFLAQAQAGSKYVVTLKASASSINEGSPVTLSGKVSPGAAGKTITLQRRTEFEGDVDWGNAKTTTIKSDGTFSKKITPLEGIETWRAHKPAGSGHDSGTSASVTFKVYTWFKMANTANTDLEVASGESNLGRYGSISVAGTTVSRYFATNQLAQDTTRWYVQHHCKRIRVDVGLWDDGANEDSVGQFRIFADSDKIASVKVRYGTSTAVEESFSESKTGSIKFTGEQRVEGPTPIVASNPRVLCAGIQTSD